MNDLDRRTVRAVYTNGPWNVYVSIKSMNLKEILEES